MRGGTRTAAAWIFVVLTVACSRYRWDEPAEAYNSFVLAFQRSDFKTAWSALSEGTRKRIAARAKEASEASGGALKDDPAAIFFSSLQKPAPVTSIVADGGSVLVKTSQGEHTVKMVKEGEAWKVDLEDAVP